MRRVVRDAPHDTFGYGDPRGQAELRAALSEYLGRVRGVVTDSARMLVCAGFNQALRLVCDTLRERGVTTFAVEDPCSPLYREIVADAGLSVHSVPCDGEGLRVDLLAGSAAGAVLVTPAHQYPSGATMSADRRTALARWARERGAYVVEDDYDGEFRYDRHPVGALQALDPEWVVYAGTATKTLAPALRLGWLVAPGGLMPALLRRKERLDRGGASVDQLVLAELIRSGDFDRHVRRSRVAYRRRLDRLRALFPQVIGTAAGLQVMLPLAISEARVLARARRRGLALRAVGPYCSRPADPGLIIGFGTPPAHAYEPALAALAETVRTS